MQVSVDMSMVDLDIPFTFGNVLALAADMVTMIVLIAIATWEILLIAIPATILIQYIQVNFIGAFIRKHPEVCASIFIYVCIHAGTYDMYLHMYGVYACVCISHLQIF